jgi:hypothetical protein
MTPRIPGDTTAWLWMQRHRTSLHAQNVQNLLIERADSGTAVARAIGS